MPVTIDTPDHPGIAIAGAIWEGPVGMGQLDRDLRFVALNATLAQMNGLPVEAHIGRTPMDLFPGLPNETIEALRSVIRTGQAIVGHELVIDTAALPGVPRAWLESYLPIRNASGDVDGVAFLVVEVTKRRAAEDRMRQLQTVTAALSAALTPREVGEATVGEAVRTFGAARAALYLPAGETLELVASAGFARELPSQWSSFAVTAATPVGQVALTGEPLFASSLDDLAASHPVLVRLAGEAGVTSLAILPVEAGQDAGGVLVISFRAPGSASRRSASGPRRSARSAARR